VRVDVINTGTELVLGRTLNTHLGYLGEKLFLAGLRIQRQLCIPDGEVIGEVLTERFSHADIMIVTGGLGPTSDDITRELTAELLGLELRLDEAVADNIKGYYARRTRPFGEGGRRQAMVPEGAIVLPNGNGTAPGLYLPKTDRNPHLFLLPGPPRELYLMFEDHVLPRLLEIVGRSDVESREWKFCGLGESELAEHLEPPLSKIPNLEIGYCAKTMEVHLRCLGDENALAQADAVVREIFPHQLVSDDLESIEAVIVRLLAERKQWVTAAESCTGGFLAHRLTNVSGASSVLAETHVTYANEAKTRLLGVDPEAIAEFGVVSDRVVTQMAEGALKISGADHALAVTGIAGPTGGSDAKPVGTVYLAIASKDAETHAEKCFYPIDREAFKWRTSQRALDLLRRRLLGYPLADG
jgi:nicotinamide-nucleotide amidase